MSVEDVALTFSNPTGQAALRYLKGAMGYDDSCPEYAAEFLGGAQVPAYCPVRMAFRAGMREAIINIETAIERGLQQIDDRS